VAAAAAEAEAAAAAEADVDVAMNTDASGVGGNGNENGDGIDNGVGISVATMIVDENTDATVRSLFAADWRRRWRRVGGATKPLRRALDAWALEEVSNHLRFFLFFVILCSFI
jgi:hypothetical protein